MPATIRRTIRYRLAALLMSVVSAAAAHDEAPAVFATYAYTRYDRAAALAPLAAHLSATLGRPVAVRVLESPRALAAALRDGSVDAAVTNTFVYLAVRNDAAVSALAAFDVPAATLDGYRGVLLARRQAAGSLADVRSAAAQLRYAQVIPGSTSGGLVQDLHFAANGIDTRTFAKTSYAGTHDGALAALLDGSADIAALADAPWQAERRKRAAGDIVELWRSPPIPPGPIVCRNGGRLDCARVGTVLAALHEQAPEALAAVVAAWSESAGAKRVVPVDQAPYRALLDSLGNAGIVNAALERAL